VLERRAVPSSSRGEGRLEVEGAPQMEVEVVGTGERWRALMEREGR
jgi:hypothetical protein